MADASPPDLPDNELEARIRGIVREELIRAQTPPDEARLSFWQAVEELGISAQTLYAWKRKGMLSAERKGGQLTFLHREVVAIKQARQAGRKERSSQDNHSPPAPPDAAS